MRALKATPGAGSATGRPSAAGHVARRSLRERPKQEFRTFTVEPKAIPLDWLEVRCAVGRQRDARPWGNDDVVALGDRFTLERASSGTRAFTRHDRLRHTETGALVAEVWSCPRNETALRPNEVKVKCENATLYNFTWYPVLAELMDGLGWKYQAVTKLDVAADGYGFIAPWEACDRRTMVHGGRSLWSVDNYPGVKGVRSITVASRGAHKFARIYKKELEILKSGKFYIHDYWAKCGLSPAGVERCEIAVKGAELRRYFDDSSRSFLEQLTDPLSRVEVFRSLAAKFIRFHTGEERSRDREDLLNWDWTGIDKAEALTVAPRAPRVLDLGTNFIKGHIKLSYMLHVATGSLRYLSTAQEVAAAANLGAWLEKNRELFRRDAEKLNAVGLRASGLFDMMQGSDTDFDEALRALPTAKNERRSSLIRSADERRTIVPPDESAPKLAPGYAAKYDRARKAKR